jgi:hypothetical protein
MGRPAARGCRLPAPRLAPAARFLGLWLAVLALAAPLVPWSHEDSTDEVEWTAIAILHWQQLTRGGPPAGLEFEDEAALAAGPWRSGAQRTLFGFPSANLPKLVWGAVLDAAGRRSADPIVFDAFEQRDRERGARAERELAPALRIARGVTFAVTGLAGALLVLLAREFAPGRRGWWCAALALALWLATPAVRESATFVRGDPFLLAATLATLLAALRRRAALRGERGGRALLAAGAGLGLACGLVVSAKLNGVFVVPLIAAWMAQAWLGGPRASPRAAGAALLAFALAACATFFVLHPALWDAPLQALGQALERWRWMRAFLREDWGPRARLIVPESFGAGWNLFVHRLCLREDPWRVLCALPLRPALLPLALGAAAWTGLRAAEGPARDAARLLALCMLVLGLGTAAWLPVDWSRYWLSALIPVTLLEARAVVALVERVARGRVRKGAHAPEAR